MTGITCGKCGNRLSPALYNTGEPRACAACGSPVRVEAFPALLRAVEAGNAGQRLIAEEDASCFYHPGKKAEVPCDACGRFLCGLCDMELNGRHLCPACLETSSKQKEERNEGDSRILYDRATLGLAVLPIFTVWLTILTAPATIYMVLRYWNKPSSILGSSKASMVAAFIIALLEIGGWAAVFILT